MNFTIDPTISMSVVLSVIVITFTWFRTRRHDVDVRFEAAHTLMDKHDKRIASLEQTVGVMPSKDDMHALQLELARMVGKLGQIQATMDGNAKIMERLETIVSRHEDHLIDGARK